MRAATWDKDSFHGTQGNINIINAAVKKGVKKFILVTSIGVGDSKDAPPKQASPAVPHMIEGKSSCQGLSVLLIHSLHEA